MAFNKWKPEDLATCLSPGRTVTVSVLFDTPQPDGRVSGLKVLYCANNDLVLEWPRNEGQPPPLGTGLLISLLRRDADRTRRYGFQTSVIDILGPQPSQSADDSALMVIKPRPEDIEPLDYRRRKRYKLAEPGLLGAVLEEHGAVSPMDISDRGMRYSCDGVGDSIEPGRVLDLMLTINNSPYRAVVQVVNITDRDGRQEVSVKFRTLTLDLRAALLDAFKYLEPLDGPVEYF